ncbi:MAG: glycosyltransferase [Lachnospiraceae bacterium]|nr:glycosyltransferase [Lachnospiraceae bacterium]
MDIDGLRTGLNKIRDYTERNGADAAFFRVLEGLKEWADDRSYSREVLMLPETGDTETKESGFFLSVIIPVYSPDMDDFAHLLDSLLRQTYTDFEVVIADGSADTAIENVVKVYDGDPDVHLLIKYERLKENLGISGNTNEALKRAEGDYVVFIDHDDFIEPDALLETVKAIKEGAELIYTDEDKYDGVRDRYFCPNRKPDFNLDLLLSNNYICHMLTVRKDLVEKAGGFRSGYDGAQDHDLLLRLSEIIPREKTAHIPKILYHWRLSENSTAGNPESKVYAYDNGKKAVEDYFSRRGIGASVHHTSHRGFFRADYSGAEAAEDSCRIFVDRSLQSLTPGYEKLLRGYFAREEVGIVGAAIIGKSGRTVSNGYTKLPDGTRTAEYGKIDYRFSGYMHRAHMIRETEAVSAHAFAIRKELLDTVSRDVFHMCGRVRERGFSVIVDPNIIFKLR